MASSDLLASRQAAQYRALPLLLVLFVGSGCAALIYEIVWFQLLEFKIGGDAVSFGVLLGTFMGGMCLGSLLLPRVVSPRYNPLYVYAALELGIALISFVVLWGLPWVSDLYAGMSRGGSDLFFRALIAALFLLPPTILMGATLPAVARSVKATPHGVAWLGFFYGGNIAGAVCGSLLASFYLLRVYDMATASYVAAAINVVVALLAVGGARLIPYTEQTEEAASADSAPLKKDWSIYIAIGLSGASALGAEVVWTRLLSLMIGGSVYTFSIILAMFLIGLGIGSSFGAGISRGKNPRLWLGLCQFLLMGAIAWAAYQQTKSLPYWPIDPELTQNPWHKFQLDLLRCGWAVLPAAVLWGASFPLALAAAAERSRDPGRLVAGVYAANTIGAIVGSLGFSIGVVMINEQQRSQHSQQMLVILAGISTLITLVPWGLRQMYKGEAREESDPAKELKVIGALSLAIVAGGFFVYSIPQTPGDLIAHGRYLPHRLRDAFPSTVKYQGEGLNSSIAITEQNDGSNGISFHVSGKVEASSQPADMRLQRMLGHIPALVHPKPKSVLIVGCGAGVTSGSFCVHPSIERIVICELEPLIPTKIAKEWFYKQNHNVITDKRCEVVYDDARHFMLTCKEKFDIITSDPIHPWVKGAASLYTKEYFELCKARLNKGGVVTQWIPLYESTPAVVQSEIKTFAEVFPHSTLWSNDNAGQGYDTVLLGQDEPTVIDIRALIDRVDKSEDHVFVRDSLAEVGFKTTLDVLATYAGNTDEFAPYLENAEINSDRNLRLQYLAGFGSHQYLEAKIYKDILKFRTYPDKIFIAGDDVAPLLKLKMFGVSPKKVDLIPDEDALLDPAITP